MHSSASLRARHMRSLPNSREIVGGRLPLLPGVCAPWPGVCASSATWLSPPAGEGALDARITYVSRSLAWRMGTEPAAALGRSLVEMCHPEDQGAFCAELARARAAPDGRVNFLHRCLGRDGVPEWCRAVGMFAADALYLVFRDVRPTKTAELALRAFTLAASAELREPCNTIAVVLPVLARRPCIAAGARKPPDMHGGAAGGALSGQHAPVMHAAELMDAMWASA